MTVLILHIECSLSSCQATNRAMSHGGRIETDRDWSSDVTMGQSVV